MLASPAADLSSPASERVAVVIPALNEAESIGAVIAALPRHLVDTVIVAVSRPILISARARATALQSIKCVHLDSEGQDWEPWQAYDASKWTPRWSIHGRIGSLTLRSPTAKPVCWLT